MEKLKKKTVTELSSQHILSEALIHDLNFWWMMNYANIRQKKKK